MNAATELKMNWAKRSAHQWLEQYGAWVRTAKTQVSANPLAILIDRNDKTRIHASKVSIPVDIEDHEAVRVSKLLAKMHNDGREFMQERAWFLILFYENNWSYLSIAIARGCSKAKVRAEIDKGLSYLDGVIENLPY